MERVPAPELAAFERHKPDLVARFPGQFAILLGETLVGVEASLEAALAATADRLEQGALPPGIPILISEIAEAPRLLVSTELAV
jgi:hypothetical protein